MSGLGIKYRVSLAVIAIMLVGCMFIGSSYAYWKVEKVQTNPNIIKTGCFDIEWINESSSINLDKAYPISNAKGLASADKYTFTIHNNCTIAADYNLYLNVLDVSSKISSTIKGQIPTDLIMYALQKTTDSYAVVNNLSTCTNSINDIDNFDNKSLITSSRIIGDGHLAPGASDSYILRLWINEVATVGINYYRFEADVATIATAANE